MSRHINGQTVGLFVILIIAGILRIYDLGGRDLWIDEANSVLMAQEGGIGLMTRLKLDSSPPLYYLVLNLWAKLFGDTEAALRSLSVIGGILLVVSVFVTSRRCLGRRTAIIAALVIALAPIQIFYSQQSRMYVWLSVLALWSFHWLWCYATTDRMRYLIGYGLATLAALYTHNYALYLLPAHFIALMSLGASRRRLARWFIVGLGIALGYVPWIPVLLEQLRSETHYAWYAVFWQQFGPSGALWRSLQSFTPTGMQPPYVALRGDPDFGYMAALVMGMLVILSFLAVLSWRRAQHNEHNFVLVIGSYLLVPVFTAVIISMFLTPNHVPGRSDQLVFPAFAILVAYGAAQVRPVVLRGVLVGGIVALSAIGLTNYYGKYPGNSDRVISKEISRRAQAGDAVLCTSLTRAPVEYYLRRFEAPIQIFSYPRDTALHMGNQNDAALLANPQYLLEEASAVEQDIRKVCGHDARVFLVLNKSKVNGYIHHYLVESGRTQFIEMVGKFTQAGTGQPIVVILLRL